MSTTPTFDNVTFSVSGMTCASCVRSIERTLTKVPGVENASVNLATEMAWVTFDPAIVDLPQLKDAVAKAGYRVGKVALTSPSQQLADVAPLTGEETFDQHERERQSELDELKRKSFVSLGVGLVMMP